MTYTEIIESWRKIDSEQDFKFFGGLNGNISEAILHAGLCRYPNGKTMAHMERLDLGALARGTIALNSNRVRLLRARTFDQLHDTIDDLCGNISGLKEMYVYDTAYRIGAALQLYPEAVYLHKGTRDGAVALGFDGARKSIPISEFAPEFQSLEPRELESLLCRFSKELLEAKLEDAG